MQVLVVEMQTWEIWLNFYFVLQMYSVIGYLWLNPEDLNFSILTFRFLPCQTPSQSCFNSSVHGGKLEMEESH